MKKIHLTFVFLLYAATAFCQQKTAVSKISAGVAAAFPTGNTAQSYRRGFGGSLLGEYNLVRNLNLVASVGFMGFEYRKDVRARLQNYGQETHVSGVIPLKAGLRYYFGSIYYLDAEAGCVFTTGTDHFNAFTYTPGVGTSIPISTKYSMDFGLRYEGWIRESQSVSFFGARVAFAFVL
jgi:hypothetical protein